VQVFIGCSARIHTTFYGGRFAETLALAEEAAALYEPNSLPEFSQAFGEESSLLPHAYHFWALWILGQPGAAVRKLNFVKEAVEPLRSPFLSAMALLFEMVLWHELRDTERVASVSERLFSLAGEQEFALPYSFAHVSKGWAACQRGDLEGGMPLIQAGLALQRAAGIRLPMAYWVSYLVEAHLASGRLTEGLAATREALSWSETQLDVFVDSELLRLEGELLRASGDSHAAEASFRKALEIARGQGARSFELRTATSLGRLLAEQGRVSEALPALAAVYQTFSEGLATPDLTEARDLLDRFSLY
jgi:predicted ATPase